MALAFGGACPRFSETLADDPEKSPEDISVRFSHAPTVRAVLAPKRGDPAKAIEQFQIAVHYELSAPRSTLQGLFGALYPLYVRGLVYLLRMMDVKPQTSFRRLWIIAASLRPTPFAAWCTCVGEIYT